MPRNRGSGSIAEWILVGSTTLFAVVIFTFILLSALGGNQIFAAILSGALGAAAGVGLARLTATLTRNGRGSLVLVVPVYVSVLVALVAYPFLFSPDWLTNDSSGDAFLPAPLAALTGFVGGALDFFWYLIRKHFRRSEGRL